LLLYVGGIALIAISSIVCAVLRIPVETRLWEFPIDFRIVAAFALVLFSARGNLSASIEPLGLRKWSWRYFSLAFCAPAVLLLSVILIGFAAKTVEFQGVENTLTFWLSAVLDLPAFFFFSLTTIFLEEVIFRGMIVNKLAAERTYFSAIAISSVLWAVLRIADAQDSGAGVLSSVMVRFLYYSILGTLLCQIYSIYGSIWITYSFRVGLATFSSLLLSSADSEVNSLFTANTAQFDHHGLAIVGVFCICVVVLQKLPLSAKKPQVH